MVSLSVTRKQISGNVKEAKMRVLGFVLYSSSLSFSE